MSQENVSDKVRNLQRQIAQNIKFGQKPPSQRRSEEEEGSSDEEEAPRSPLKVLAQVEAEPGEVEAEPGETEPKVQGAEPGHSTPVKSPRSKRILPATGTIESINLDSVPQSVPRLDNTAAKHKLAVKPKNQRVSRKHRRFTQEVSLSDVLPEEAEGRKEAEPAGTPTDGKQTTPGPADQDYDSLETSKKQRIQEREEKRESRRKRRESDEERLREEAQEERRRRAEEQRLREAEEERCRRRQEEEKLRKEAEEEEKKREDAERRRREEERRAREEEERAQREEEERRIRLEEEERKRIQEEERRRAEEEEERRKKREEEERRRKEEEEERRRKEEEERLREEREEAERLRKLEEERRLQEEKEKEEEEEAQRRRLAACQGTPDDRQRRAEELRWREMEERQRPFSFKVSSSGEKQILFQKVHLTPVSPSSAQQGGAVQDLTEGGSVSKASSSSSTPADSANLPSSQYIPHTAILVTGAQLCGPAVQLDQIRDPACKSLLGLGDDKKAMGAPPKSKASPERKSGKTKSLNESSLSTDQSSAAILAEWASIRSKIFKGAEEGWKYEDYPEPGQNQNPNQNQTPAGSGENQSPFPHTNLRKTMSASAKFSITPAKKKFSDSKRNSELWGPEDKEGGKTDGSPSPDGSPVHQTHQTQQAQQPGQQQQTQGMVGKTVRIAHRSDGCVFAKDLPSFLVPNPAQGSADGVRTPEGGGESYRSDGGGREEGDEDARRGQGGGQDKPPPFGIKLRRTNYSLRFHSEQPTEKRKKRYSAGDSFDGVPSPLTPIEPESASSPGLSSSNTAPGGPVSPLRESRPAHAATSEPRTRTDKGPFPSSSSNVLSEAKTPPKPSSVYHQRATVSSSPSSSKPAGASSTAPPPPPPLPKSVRGGAGSEVPGRRASATQQEASPGEEERGGERREESSAVAQLHRSSQGGEEEPREKKSFFPSISMPWREKADRKTELIRRDKPSLQSRHSLDSVRGADKEAGPMWVTLALQKQKGFREQQQSREERRSQREAKLAEKQARERDSNGSSPSSSKSSGTSSPTPPAEPPPGARRPDSLLGRFERREHLKKASTLPSSVTVEIADSTPSPPAVKEVTKRFPAGDSGQVCTEPAWLALAKRKAKAWSDCPQIIK